MSKETRLTNKTSSKSHKVIVKPIDNAIEENFKKEVVQETQKNVDNNLANSSKFVEPTKQSKRKQIELIIKERTKSQFGIGAIKIAYDPRLFIKIF